MTQFFSRTGEAREVEGIWGNEPEATPVHSQEEKVLIPSGLVPGDTFIYTPKDGRSITVIVPENARPGTYLNIVVPDEIRVERSDGAESPKFSADNNNFKINKATAGAALVGGVIGAVVFGPVGAVVLAGGAAYATTRKKGSVGVTARKVGNQTMGGIEKASKWVSKKISATNT